MKLKTIFLFIILIFIQISCRTLKELRTLSNCEFRLSAIENPSLAGVSIFDKRRFSDLNLRDAGKIITSLTKGELPLIFTLNVEVKNPNPKLAALNQLEWIAFIDDIEIFSGTMAERVEIPPYNGISPIPLNIKTDLMEVLSKSSRQAILNFGFNLADMGKKPTRVTLKVKPAIMIGKKLLKYPGYIKVNKDFNSDQVE